jgi:hypothetical protein
MPGWHIFSIAADRAGAMTARQPLWRNHSLAHLNPDTPLLNAQDLFTTKQSNCLTPAGAGLQRKANALAALLSVCWWSRTACIR